MSEPRSSRASVAPSAARIASSPCRLVIRATTSIAKLTAATSSSPAANPNTASSSGRIGPTAFSSSSIAPVVSPVLVSGQSRARRCVDRSQLRARLVERDAVAQSGEHPKRSAAPIGGAIGQRQRDPRLGSCLPERREPERRRHDADHAIRLAVDDDRAPDHCRVAAETPDPQSVGEHDDAHVAGHVVFGDRPANERSSAKHVEQRAGHLQRRHALGAPLSGQVGAPRLCGGHPAERPRRAADIVEIGRRHRAAHRAAVQDRHEAVGLSIGQRRQQHASHHGRKRGDRPDAQRQRRHGGDRERAIAKQRPNGKS